MQALPLIAELEAVLTSGAASRRVEMLSRITDLFVAGASYYSQEQIGVFDDVLARLAGTVDAGARAKLAQRLAPLGSAPPNLIQMLAFDTDIEVASPVLSQSERLDESAVLSHVRRASQRHLMAIAQRRSLSEAATDLMIECGDRDVLHAVVNNPGSRFSEAGFRRLIERSAGDDDLAAAIGRRSSAAPTTQPHAQGPNRSERGSEAELFQCARDRKFDDTARMLSALCDTPIELVERALLDPTAELVLILAKVAGLSSATAKALLLLQATDRGMSATDLDHALSSFERLHPATARRVLDFFRTRLKKPARPTISPAAAVNL